MVWTETEWRSDETNFSKIVEWHNIIINLLIDFNHFIGLLRLGDKLLLYTSDKGQTASDLFNKFYGFLISTRKKPARPTTFLCIELTN